MLNGMGELLDLAKLGGTELKDVAEHEIESGLEICGALSFRPDTQVAVSTGKQAIGSLKVGDKVWAYNPPTKKMELQPIEKVWINHDDDLVDLTITTTKPTTKNHPEEQTSEVIHTNKKHPFLTQEEGFVPVSDLPILMHVVKADGSVGMITSWQVVPGTQTMYNLAVAQDHTYTVCLWAVGGS